MAAFNSQLVVPKVQARWAEVRPLKKKLPSMTPLLLVTKYCMPWDTLQMRMSFAYNWCGGRNKGQSYCCAHHNCSQTWPETETLPEAHISTYHEPYAPRVCAMYPQSCTLPSPSPWPSIWLVSKEPFGAVSLLKSENENPFHHCRSRHPEICPWPRNYLKLVASWILVYAKPCRVTRPTTNAK